MFELWRGRVRAALFHFDATNEGSPRTQCVYYKVPSGSATLPPHQTGTCAAVFSVQWFYSTLFSRRRGVDCIRSPLGSEKGTILGPLQGWAPDVRREEFVGAGTDVFL